MSFEFTGTVETVEVKKAKSGGKTYYRLNIPQDGSNRWHTSFDSKVTELQGETINFNAKPTKFGHDLLDYEIVAPVQETPAQPAPAYSGGGKSGRENVWIATQGIVNRGIEVGFYRNTVDALSWFFRIYPIMEAMWDGDEVAAQEMLEQLEYQEEPPEEAQA